MERRRGALPISTSKPNSVPNYLSQQTSFCSTDSTDSNESFRTQIPLDYHLPQDHPANQDYAVGGNRNGIAQQSQTGSNGSPALNPTSSPYIPQGNTPVLPSTGFNVQTWGVSYMANGRNDGMAASYQQSGQRMTDMQYQSGNQYQQQGQMQLGGPVGGMNPQLSNSGADPYAHFGAGGNAQNSSMALNNPNGQIGFNTLTLPEMTYSATISGQGLGFGLPYVAGVVAQPGNEMYDNGANIMYGSSNVGSSSFYSNPNLMNNGPNAASISFNSAPGNMYSSQTQGFNFKSGPGSSHSNASSKRNKKKQKGLAAFSGNGKERMGNADSYRSNQRSSNSSTPALGGPVKAPQDGARISSPEKDISKSTTPEPSRNQKNMVAEQTRAVPTPVHKRRPSDIDLISEQRRTETKTPQLRSVRGKTIASATDPIRKQSVSDWAVAVRESTDDRNSDLEEMKCCGSPIEAMGMLTINEADPFLTSVDGVNPFSCMTPGPFTAGFGACPLSPELLALTCNGTQNPTIAEALDPYNVPFQEYCRLVKPEKYGVIKFKNIPYGVNRAEILAFLGRNARVVNESEFEPIHIIMERVTSKTLDCFVEFTSLNEAVSAVNRFDQNRMGGKGGRLGQRHVDVELSTQGALMKELFPKAKNVQWEASRPYIIPRDQNDPYNSGFQGFISKEELIMMVKHVESPQRSPFGKDCPQRSFECLISTLVKYPWYMVDHITIEDRIQLHEVTKRMLELLIERVANNEDKINLNHILLKRVWRAALKCPGFTPSMKDDIAVIADLDHATSIEFGLPPYAPFWNKLWTLGPKPTVPVDVIMWYAAKVREACTTTQQLSLAELAEKGEAELPKEAKLFGDLDKYINYGGGVGQMTLAQVAKIEWAAIENALRRAFTPLLH